MSNEDGMDVVSGNDHKEGVSSAKSDEDGDRADALKETERLARRQKLVEERDRQAVLARAAWIRAKAATRDAEACAKKLAEDLAVEEAQATAEDGTDIVSDNDHAAIGDEEDNQADDDYVADDHGTGG